MDKTNNHYGYDKDSYTALEAITEAQKIAFAPMIFQNALILRDSGILALLDKAGKKGCSLAELIDQIELSEYAIKLLLDMGLSSHIIYQPEENYLLAKIGHFLLHDKMTRVNMDFSQDVCYQGLFHLKEAFGTGKPKGLSVFSQAATIYPILSELPKQAKQSWFAFDHFYSDGAFNEAFKHIQKLNPKHLYDIGGNTGKWAIHCVTNDAQLKVTILDLPEQITLLEQNIHKLQLADRIKGIAVDMLTASTLPNEADLWWMSQFLDCFSPSQIVHILSLIREAMPTNSKVCILECFWDRQPYEAGALSLNATSLYFTAMANGNSRFYHSKDFYSYLQQAGFQVEQDIDNLGISHTLLICSKV